MTIAPEVCNTGRGSPQPTDGATRMQHARRLIACVYTAATHASFMATGITSFAFILAANVQAELREIR